MALQPQQVARRSPQVTRPVACRSLPQVLWWLEKSGLLSLEKHQTRPLLPTLPGTILPFITKNSALQLRLASQSPLFPAQIPGHLPKQMQ